MNKVNPNIASLLKNIYTWITNLGARSIFFIFIYFFFLIYLK